MWLVVLKGQGREEAADPTSTAAASTLSMTATGIFIGTSWDGYVVSAHLAASEGHRDLFASVERYFIPDRRLKGEIVDVIYDFGCGVREVAIESS